MGACFGVLLIFLPYFALLYYVGKCRVTCTGLPWGYTTLLAIVGSTWILFPAWWFVSFEGMNLLPNTKLNALGFALLNMTSKGLFTLQMLRIARHEKQRAEDAEEQAVDPADVEMASTSSASTNSTYRWLMGCE